MAKYTLKAWLADNTVTNDDKTDKILLLESAGNLTQKDILDRMKQEDTGLRNETLEHVVNLYHRMMKAQLLNGYSINTGMFRATPQFRGVVQGGTWDDKINSIYISFTQDKELREGIKETSVQILGEKGDTMYIISGEDASTKLTDGSATAGRNYILYGKKIKVEGDDAKVGITLTAADNTVTPIPLDMLAVNDPSKLIVLLPVGLAAGEYTLTVTTQFSSNVSKLLKEPRSASRSITVV